VPADLEPRLRDAGWVRFPPGEALVHWSTAARRVVEAIASSPDAARWYRHGRTWFAGVNLLPNDDTGALAGGPALEGNAIDLCRNLVAPQPLRFDRGQVSICFPGYPQRDPEESESSHRYRLVRDAAHADGLHAEGPDRRRFVREHHGFILGIPLGAVGPSQSPVVVWEGSHLIIREALRAAVAHADPTQWAAVDITEAYHAARRRVFETCRRVEIVAQPGEAYVIHRLALHGIAPWTAPEAAPRTVIYFRPVLDEPQAWLALP
jgi:hypothetical protein